MQSFVAGIIIKVLSDKKIQEFIIKLAKLLLDSVISEKLITFLQFSLGSAMKRFAEVIPGAQQVKSAVEFAGDIAEDMDRMAESLPNTGVQSIDQFIDDFWGKDNK